MHDPRTVEQDIDKARSAKHAATAALFRTSSKTIRHPCSLDSALPFTVAITSAPASATPARSAAVITTRCSAKEVAVIRCPLTSVTAPIFYGMNSAWAPDAVVSIRSKILQPFAFSVTLARIALHSISISRIIRCHRLGFAAILIQGPGR